MKGNDLMKKFKWYRFTFADGYFFIARGMDRVEKLNEENKHGKLVSKTYEGTY